MTPCSSSSGKGTIRRRACAGCRRRHAVSSAIYYYSDEQRRAAEQSRDAYQKRLDGRGFRTDYDGDRAGTRLLLRGGLPPAVSRKESTRVLRSRRYGCQLPDRRRRNDVNRLFTNNLHFGNGSEIVAALM